MTIAAARLAVSILVLAAQQVLPKTEAETATGEKLTLPDGLAGQPSILVVGFSKKSAKASEWWEDRLSRDVAGPRRIRILRVAQLEAIPGLLRGFLLGKIKDNVPKEKRGTFLMLFHEEDAWKKVVGFDAPDDAYLVLVDATGKVSWGAHAGLDEAAYGTIEKQLVEVLASNPVGVPK